jgi:hypothetical protein
VPGILHLYRFIEDAWAGPLRDWCLEKSPAAEAWLLLENQAQSRWLLPRFAAESITHIRLLDACALRDELARRAGLKPPQEPFAATELAIKAALAQLDSDPARAAARNARALAAACDTLTRAGWHLSQLALDPAITRALQRAMDRAAILPALIDRSLQKSLAPQPIRLCCLGWDATRWPDLALLDLAAGKSQSCEIFTPMPRLPADALQQEWIETLEQRLALVRTACPETGFQSENEPLVSRLENSELAGRAEAKPPILLVGREWPDQLRLVCDQVAAWLRGPSSGPIAVVAPDNSPTAHSLAEALQSAGIPVEAPSRPREPSAPILILEQGARYHLNAHDIDDFIVFINLLWQHARASWPHLEPNLVRETLNTAFSEAQTRNTRILARALPYRKDALWSSVCELIESLGRWDSKKPWPQLLEKWRTLLTALHLPAADLPIPPDLNLPADTPIPERAIMEWLASDLAARRLGLPVPDYGTPAPVVITTFAGAAQQPWGRIIFLDSNEHIWPVPIAENPALPDAKILQLNRARGDTARILSTRDFRLLEQARFLDLVENTRHPIAFAGVAIDHTESGDHAQPNEWVQRALLETNSPADLWQTSIQSFPPPPHAALGPADLAHLQQVTSSRHNPTIPFDRYLFNFHESKLEPSAWSATHLDYAIKTPATFALRELFDAEAAEDFARNEGSAVGNRAHRWLARILGLGDHLAPPRAAVDDNAAVARELAATSRELEEWFASENLPLPLWWDGTLRKTAWAARRCLREVRAWLGAEYCAMEQKLAVSVHTPGGPLLLKGRIDILIADAPQIPGARVRMFDFKTGRGDAPSLTTLDTGSGAQFAAYYLMARDAGAAQAVIGIIKPEEAARDVFGPADETALRAHFGRFADLWRDLRFGRTGPLVTDHGTCESLPLATVPIDPAILEQKAALILLAS